MLLDVSRFQLLSDARWVLIEGLLPVRTGRRGGPFLLWGTVLSFPLATAALAGKIGWAVSSDSTIARAHQHATTIARVTGDCSGGLGRTSRICWASRLATRSAGSVVVGARKCTTSSMGTA